MQECINDDIKVLSIPMEARLKVADFSFHCAFFMQSSEIQ